MAGFGLTSSRPVKGVGILLCILSFVKIFRLIQKYRKFFKFFNSMPGETDFHWLWGNMHKLFGNTEDRIKYGKDLLLKYPKFNRMWAGPFVPVINLSHPDTVKALLKSSEPKPRSFGGTYAFALPWLGDGLLLAGGQRWARARRLLTPAFHFDILRPYVDIYNNAADILLSKIDRFAESGESFELFSQISMCTLDVILQCAMSFEDDIQVKGESHPYVQAVNELSDLWFDRARNPVLFPDIVFYLTREGRRFREKCHFVHSVSEDIIEKRKQALDKSGPPKNRYLDFLDILLTAKDDSGGGLTPLEIRNEVDTFLFEGHDTTASAISWILYSLATHGDFQSEVQKEVDGILEHREHDVIEWNDLHQLEYLSRVIKEGMRLHCPVPLAQRELTSPTVIEGRTLPTGTICTIHLLNLHHNSEVWEEPWEFRPDRFLPANIKEKDSYAFVPFSAGPRNCIGQHFALNEEKVLLARILHRYQLEPDPDHVVKRKVAAVMRAENGIRVFAKRRV